MFGLPLIALARSAGCDDGKIAAARSPTLNDFSLFFLKHLFKARGIRPSVLKLVVFLFYSHVHVAFFVYHETNHDCYERLRGLLPMNDSILKKKVQENFHQFVKNGEKCKSCNAGTFYNE